MIVLKNLIGILYIFISTNLFILVSCSSNIKLQTNRTTNQTLAKQQQQQESVDDILKDTLQLLDGLDKKLFQVNNATRNLRSLELDHQLSSRDEEELTRLAENFTPERQLIKQINHGESMSALASANDYKSIVEPVQESEGGAHTLAQVFGTSKKFRQLNSANNNSSASSAHFDNDFTERHIHFSLDLMQALFAANTNDAAAAAAAANSKQQRNNNLESFIISPVSIQVVLMMMHLGARGQTKRELANCLHLPQPYDSHLISLSETQTPTSTLSFSSSSTNNGNKLRRRNPQQQQQQQQQKQSSISNNNVHELFGAAMKNLLKDPAVVKALTSANQIFLQRELNLLTPYEQAVRHYYNVDLKSVDFQQQPQQQQQNFTLNSTATQSHSQQQQQQQQQSIKLIHEEQSVQQLINDWVERQTRGKISNFLQSPVPSSTLLMAINVLFFKGDWQYKFDPSDTDPDAWFTLANGKTIKLPMMVNRLPLAHAYDPTMKTSVIELPYKAQRLGLFVLLPDEADGVFDLMRQLNSTTFANLISMMRKSAPAQPVASGAAGAASAVDISAANLAATGINVRIPKFTIESSPRLSQILSKQLGLKSLFSADLADLSGMFGGRTAAATTNAGATSHNGSHTVQNSARRLSSNATSTLTSSPIVQVGLDELMHKAVLQVHEQGSVAAAASATIVERVGLFNGQYFEADHPFLIFLMDKQTGLVLFSGLFAGPTSDNDSGHHHNHHHQSSNS